MDDPIVTFLSDYGLADGFVGICHGVIARRCPRARIIDITHLIPRQDVRRGAWVLQDAVPFLPAAVHLAVVDPGVGGARRALAVQTVERQFLVGPDNGLLMAAADALGGPASAVDISNSPLRLEPLSATFHGRDVFAPVAAALAGGATLGDVGTPVDPEHLVRLEQIPVRREGDTLIAAVALVDTYGNVALSIRARELPVEPGGRVLASWAGQELELRLGRAFADVAPGSPLLYEDSFGRLAIAVAHGSAADSFDLHEGAEVRLRVRVGAR